jgi:hypothetical protein
MLTPAKSTLLLRAATALALAALCSATARAKVPAPPVPQQYYSQWVEQFMPTATLAQQSTAVAVDTRGNSIVTGFGFDSDGTTRYFYTAKYDALDGHLDWASTYVDPDGDAFANSIAVDPQGNVYVGGGAIGSDATEDFYLIKYSGLDGSETWARSYNGTAGGQDEIRKVIYVPFNGDVVVTGISAGDSEGLDFETIEYTSAGGLVWSRRYDFDEQDDVPAGVACDSAGNIYVAGSVTDGDQDQRFLTLRYAANGGASNTPTWARNYLSPGGGYGATSVAVDGNGDIITTGHYQDASSPPNDGFYTIKYSPSASAPNGGVIWSVLESGQGNDPVAGATSVTVDGSNNVLVTGALNTGGQFAVNEINTFKYDTDGDFIWGIADSGTAGGPSHAIQIATDSAGNAIVVGDVNNGTPFSQDIYTAKYSQDDGHTIWSASYGSANDPENFGSTDVAAGLALDANGDVAITGNPIQDVLDTGNGYFEFVAIKYNRLLLETNDPLPATTGLAANPTLFTADPPALSDSAGIATLVTVNSGRAKPTAILTQNTGGGIFLPAVQGVAAPGNDGNSSFISTASPGNYALFSDPVIAPNGAYAFAGKVGGHGVSPARANGVWENLTGTLQLAIQQGVAVPGLPSEKVVSVNSLAIRNNQLLALLTITGPPTKNSLLLGIDASDNATPLVQSGDTLLINGVVETIKTITVLSPTVLSPGDGRWQGDTNTVIRIVTTKGVTAICVVPTTGGVTPILYTGEDTSGILGIASTFKSFGLPAVGPSGEEYTTLATIAPVKGSITAANDMFLLYSFDGSSFDSYLQEGTTDSNLAEAKYGPLTDPCINSGGYSAAIVSLTGPHFTAANNKLLLWGSGFLGLTGIARLGDFATDSTGGLDSTDAAKYTSFVSFSLPSGDEPVAPIFVAKLAGHGITAKNNEGLWAYSTHEEFPALRRLLRTGDVLGTRTVASFTILKAPSKAFAAARNFNATAEVAVMVHFTDLTQAVVVLGIP